jgi:hypothetical protein
LNPTLERGFKREYKSPFFAGIIDVAATVTGKSQETTLFFKAGHGLTTIMAGHLENKLPYDTAFNVVSPLKEGRCQGAPIGGFRGRNPVLVPFFPSRVLDISGRYNPF